MINFIVVTHGEFGAYLVEAAEGIVGRQAQGVRVVATSSRQSIEDIRRRIERALAELAGPDGVLVFTDMPGGTPNNVSFPLIRDEKNVEMISGVNLYMLVSAFSGRSQLPLPRLVEKVVADGQKSIKDIRAMFVAAVGTR
ncbi:MAG: PTS galactitol transporter subunit IIBC [Elusimicrobia bacterium]|nr:PTS galactitol transporter subunit IIBC [Elusimicrobiota bacterium]